ncbi:MAG: Crp/Fnr family transcriptional regulator [Bacteroidetes bacterium]|nr:Crp/Fnr family transcriptional regulator [Bacteroidota bacterium]
MEELIYKLNLIRPLSPKLEKWLRSIIRPLTFEPGQKILVPGQICDQIYFVQKGLIRIYHMLDDAEVSDWFITNMDICVSVGSFFTQTPSREFHVALERCECWGILFPELIETYKRFPEFNIHGREIVTEYYVKLDNRSSILKRLDRDKKYEHLLATNPDFLTRISIKDMASYLDVSESTYKRMKKNYIEKMGAEAARKKRIRGSKR